MLGDIGLLILRVGAGLMLCFGHGIHKLQQFSTLAPQFPDPLHVGGRVSLGLAIFGEVVCSLLVAIGLFTRIAAIPPLITMVVALTAIHLADPFSKKEPALLYAVPFLVTLLTGPGSLSLDWLLRKQR